MSEVGHQYGFQNVHQVVKENEEGHKERWRKCPHHPKQTEHDKWATGLNVFVETIMMATCRMPAGVNFNNIDQTLFPINNICLFTRHLPR